MTVMLSSFCRWEMGVPRESAVCSGSHNTSVVEPGADSGLLDSRARYLTNKLPEIGTWATGEPGESQGLGLRGWVSWRGGKGSCHSHRQVKGAGPELGGVLVPLYLAPLSSLPTTHTRLLSVPFGDTAPPTHTLMHPGLYRN